MWKQFQSIHPFSPISLFQVNVLFLYPLKTPMVFCCFLSWYRLNYYEILHERVMTNISIIWKPVNWFVLQFNWLVLIDWIIWRYVLKTVMNSLNQNHNVGQTMQKLLQKFTTYCNLQNFPKFRWNFATYATLLLQSIYSRKT